MSNRRQFLGTVGSGIAGLSLGQLPATLIGGNDTKAGDQRRKKMAVITTVWWYHSHAWHMAERFLGGYPKDGKWHRPEIDVVSAYVDQHPEGDLSGQRAAESGFKIYPTIAQALRNGKDKLDVDCVLIIGEHGTYPLSKIGQVQYPRYEFFKQVVEVFKQDGRTAPVFNDKHLSWNFDYAKEMVDTSRAMKFPFLAGSSLPVTWRMPSVEMPHGAEIEEILCVAIGGVDIYDFHALETIQCMAERRRGGETGVAAIQALKGKPVWDAMAKGSFGAGGWSSQLFEACLSRSQTLSQAKTYSHRYPTTAQIQEWVKEPIAYRIEYNDGLKATMLLLNGLVDDFTFAAKLKNNPDPLSTMFYLPPNPNVTYSASLMSKAEEMFLTGKAPYPVERTLLTSGLVQAGMQSLADGQKRLLTPKLAVRYLAPRESHFVRS